MNVLLVNGSPHARGCTYTALYEVAQTLEAKGIQTEFFQLGIQSIRGCIACNRCNGRCIFDDDSANKLIEAIRSADGVVIGSPVYYAGPNGALCALLDRVFHAAGGAFAGKPAASVLSCRRGGASAAFDRLNKYFTISRMPVVSSQYWNAVHGNTPDEVRQDAEGLQIMRTLGQNLAWQLGCIAAGEPMPTPEPPLRTDFIR